MWTDLCVVGVGVAFHPSQIGRNTPTPTSASLAGLRAGLLGSGRKRERARWPTPSNAAARPQLAEEQARERAACARRAEVDSGGRQVLPSTVPQPPVASPPPQLTSHPLVPCSLLGSWQTNRPPGLCTRSLGLQCACSGSSRAGSPPDPGKAPSHSWGLGPSQPPLTARPSSSYLLCVPTL